MRKQFNNHNTNVSLTFSYPKDYGINAQGLPTWPFIPFPFVPENINASEKCNDY